MVIHVTNSSLTAPHVQGLFGRRHGKLKECLAFIDKQESKRSADPHKDKKRLKKYEGKLNEARQELKELSTDLVTSLADFKESYLDWFEPLINIATQMQIRHPRSAVDHILKDASLPALRHKVESSAEALRSAFRTAASQQPRSWDELLRGGLPAFARYPLAVRYLRAFAEQERVSESLEFYLAVLAFKSTWSKHSTGSSSKPGSQPSSASSNRAIMSSSNTPSAPPAASSGPFDHGTIPELDLCARTAAGSGCESPTVNVTSANPTDSLELLTQQARVIAYQFLKDGCQQEINVPQAGKLEALQAIESGYVSDSTFDKCFDDISDMLEETFMHFQSSQLATRLQTRLTTIAAHHANLLTLNARNIPLLPESSSTTSESVFDLAPIPHTTSSSKASTSGSTTSQQTPPPRLSFANREATRSLSHLSIESSTTNSSSASRSSEDSSPHSKLDRKDSHRERRQQSDSGHGSASRNAALKRAASSGEIDSSAVIQRPKKMQPSLSSSPKAIPMISRPPPKLDLPLSTSPTEARHSPSKSSTAPVETHSMRNTLQSDVSAGMFNMREPSPSSREHTSPHQSARGMRNIISSLAGLLGPKANKAKKRDTSPSDQSGDESRNSLLATLNQSNDIGPVATRHLLLVSGHYRTLLENPIGADFVIRCGPENIAFYGHSLVFSTRWPMFVNQNPKLFENIAKGVEAEVEYPTVDPDTFALAMEYLYTGTFTLGQLTDRQLVILSEFAKFRQLPGLKELANSHVLSRKSTSRIVTSLAEYIQSTATNNDMFKLEQDSKYEAYIAALAARGHELIQLPLFDYHQLHRLRRLDMVNLIRRDDFCASSEVTVFQLMLAWADKVSADQSALMENLSFLVAHIRLPLMSTEELQWVSSLGWVPQSLTAEAFKYKETGVASHPVRTKPRVSPPITYEPSSNESRPFLTNLDVLSPRVMVGTCGSSASSPRGWDDDSSPRHSRPKQIERAARRASTGREKKRSMQTISIATAKTDTSPPQSPPQSPVSDHEAKNSAAAAESAHHRASSGSPPKIRKRHRTPKDEAATPPDVRGSLPADM